MSNPVMLLGGQSRAARTILKRGLLKAPIPIVRSRGSGPFVIEIADYCVVPANIEFSGSTIVNCVGTSVGDADLLNRLNVEVPLAWARAAKRGGARHFVQISSFSLYREDVEIVQRTTPIAPATAYGRSKRNAEEKLASLADPEFTVTLLRVPMLVAGPLALEADDKLAALMRILKTIRVAPELKPDISRAMLTYEGLALAVSSVIDRREDGVVLAADPTPFSYGLVCEIAEATGNRMARFPVPAVLRRLIGKVAPRIHTRLLQSMALAEHANLLADETDFLTLRQVISQHLSPQPEIAG